jgi:hypothetical protein
VYDYSSAIAKAVKWLRDPLFIGKADQCDTLFGAHVSAAVERTIIGVITTVKRRSLFAECQSQARSMGAAN